ncbi:hypothetical protein B0H17DRAFT_1151013 [Mycena rosella]|uniref:Uncharacterized protein n=1 Tax=Mycena rosella TaxID=1033263 RepID=A0AAD7FIN4_MYCRO|nr:hypothetical protein B0H17DRAFT_1151013 [Mycena rosella]
MCDAETPRLLAVAQRIGKCTEKAEDGRECWPLRLHVDQAVPCQGICFMRLACWSQNKGDERSLFRWDYSGVQNMLPEVLVVGLADDFVTIPAPSGRAILDCARISHVTACKEIVITDGRRIAGTRAERNQASNYPTIEAEPCLLRGTEADRHRHAAASQDHDLGRRSCPERDLSPRGELGLEMGIGKLSATSGMRCKCNGPWIRWDHRYGAVF